MQKSILALTVATLLGGVSFAAAPVESAQRLSTVTTTDSMSGKLQEERAVGETGRPEWTGARRFSTTRVYLQQDPWEVGVGAWWRYRNKRDNSSVSRVTGEIEIGLPYRFQLDFYYDMAVDGDSRSRTEDFAAEVRYALADWGKIPLNPTLYAEYKWVAEGADVFEGKLLLGDQFGQGWHYGVNFVWEKELGGERTTEWQIVGGLSKTLADGRFSIGAEFKYVNESVTDNRTHPEHKFHVGPSVQWRITDRLHVDATALFGLNQYSPRQECYLVVGYDFGREDKAYQPVSATSNLRR